jgi:putative oxidoreductase
MGIMFMKLVTAKTLITFCRTRPIWGIIPLRLIFGVLLVLEGISRFTFVREHQSTLLATLPYHWGLLILIAFSVIEILAGGLVLSGLFVRLAGMVVFIEALAAIVIDRIPLSFGAEVQTQMLFIAISSLFILSGGGRYSLDHMLALRALKVHPVKKWELYCVSETSHTKWWE